MSFTLQILEQFEYLIIKTFALPFGMGSRLNYPTQRCCQTPVPYLSLRSAISDAESGESGDSVLQSDPALMGLDVNDSSHIEETAGDKSSMKLLGIDDTEAAALMAVGPNSKQAPMVKSKYSSSEWFRN